MGKGLKTKGWPEVIGGEGVMKPLGNLIVVVFTGSTLFSKLIEE